MIDLVSLQEGSRNDNFAAGLTKTLNQKAGTLFVCRNNREYLCRSRVLRWRYSILESRFVRQLAQHRVRESRTSFAAKIVFSGQPEIGIYVF